MKTVLAVLGGLVILAILVIGGGGYYMYKKGTAVVAEAADSEIQKFIATKRPPQRVSDSLNRIMNATKLRKNWMSTLLAGLVLGVIQDGTVNAEEEKMLHDSAVLAEKGDAASKEDFAAFMKTHDKVIQQYRTERQNRPAPTPPAQPQK